MNKFILNCCFFAAVWCLVQAKPPPPATGTVKNGAKVTITSSKLDLEPVDTIYGGGASIWNHYGHITPYHPYYYQAFPYNYYQGYTNPNYYGNGYYQSSSIRSNSLGYAGYNGLGGYNSFYYGGPFSPFYGQAYYGFY